MPISSRMLIPVPLEDDFFDQLSAATLLRWSKIDTEARYSVQSYIRRTFKLDKLLQPFFTSEEFAKFRALQESTGALISGSVALYFLDRAPLDVDTDLDLYVDLEFCLEIGAWLEEIGYQYQHDRRHNSKGNFHDDVLIADMEDDPPSRYSSSISEIASVYDFCRNNRTIELIACNNSAFKVTTRVHSTCVMNFITHEKAYSLYPCATFEKRISLINSLQEYPNGPDDHPNVVSKYINRGWTMIHHTGTDEYSEADSVDAHSYFKHSKRRLVGDRTCWTLTLHDPTGNTRTSTMNPAMVPAPRISLIEANSWELIKISTFECMMHSSPNLKFQYTVADRVMLKFIHKAWRSNKKVTGHNIVHKDEKFAAMILRRFAKSASKKHKKKDLDGGLST